MGNIWKKTFVLSLMIVLGVFLTSASAGTIEKIKERGALIAGVKDAVIPFGYIDAETNQLVGFDIDICRAIAKNLGVELKLKPVTSATRIPMLAQGSIDLAAATM